MKDDSFSIRDEPQFQDSSFKKEWTDKGVCNSSYSELEAIRDSVWNEPGSIKDSRSFSDWLHSRRCDCSSIGNQYFIVTAGVCGGIFAIIATILAHFVVAPESIARSFYLVLFGPVAEEFLKQSGMIYLLEKQPFRITSIWGIYICGWIAALVFGSLENLVYTHIYFPPDKTPNWESLRAFRWFVCMPGHVFGHKFLH
jgi:hypothetical protein